MRYVAVEVVWNTAKFAVVQDTALDDGKMHFVGAPHGYLAEAQAIADALNGASDGE